MKILFVSTRKNADPRDRELYEMPFLNEMLGFRRSLLDLGVMTVAACTPPDVAVEVVDEYVDPIPWDTDADLVALSAKTACVSHAYEVATEFRRRGKPVVLGGIHATVMPEEALQNVDYVVVGEADESWPEFVARFRAGTAPRVTTAPAYPALDRIPLPAWDRIDNGQFLFHQAQTTRGCPFRCRFCSVPDVSGNGFRFKPVARVVAELQQLPRSGFLKDRIKTLYFVDDNFISRRAYTRELLTALIPLRKEGVIPHWSAETTLNVARDEELLDLFAAAGCETLIIGFESISDASLEWMNKQVNFSLPYQEALARVHARGMSVVGNFILGFDTDTLSVFEETLRFVDENLILYPFFSILTPMPGTALFAEMQAAGRLDHTDWGCYDTRHVVFEPRHMTREQLMDGYCWLYWEAYGTTAALDRLERYWRRYGRRRSSAVDNALLGWRLRRLRDRGSPEFQAHLRAGMRRLGARGVPADIGQLLYFFDSAHFGDYLRRFRSADYEAHERIFRGEIAAAPAEARLAGRQWERVPAARARPARGAENALPMVS